MLQRAIYVSDATGEAGSNLLSVAEILGVSDVNNRRDRVTGVLAYHEGQFLQALEGGRTDLDRLIRRLKSDPRHSNLRFLTDGAVHERAYGQAAMQMLALNADARAILGTSTLSGLDPAGVWALLAVATGQTAMAARAAAEAV